MMEPFPKQDRPLYRWKLQDDGSLKKTVINYYKVSHFTFGDIYMYRTNNSVQSFKSDKLDRFVHNGVYSFNDDDEKIKILIIQAIEAQYLKAKIEYEKAKERWERLGKEIDN